MRKDDNENWEQCNRGKNKSKTKIIGGRAPWTPTTMFCNCKAEIMFRYIAYFRRDCFTFNPIGICVVVHFCCKYTYFICFIFAFPLVVLVYYSYINSVFRFFWRSRQTFNRIHCLIRINERGINLFFVLAMFVCLYIGQYLSIRFKSIFIQK